MHQEVAAPTIPPTKPSILFLGLKIGDILCFPINIPVQYAKVHFPMLQGIIIQQILLHFVIHGSDR